MTDQTLDPPPVSTPTLCHVQPGGPDAPSMADGLPETDEPGLKGNFSIVYEGRWRIAMVTLAFTAVAMLYALASTRVYETELLIHVELEAPRASQNILSQASALFETKQAAIAEIELLRSRMVISQAMDRLQLYLDVRPKYFPVIGTWLAERNGDQLSEPGIFGYGGFAWGAEKADVTQFDLPIAWENKAFTLTVGSGGAYRLRGAGQRYVFEGKTGQTMTWPVPGGHVALRIEQIDAKPGAQFILRRLSRLTTIESIRSAMLIAEQGLESGVIEVKLQGDDAQRIYAMLQEIGRAYMRQNLARKTEEAQKSLAFLDKQLPVLKRQMEQSEERYNVFRQNKGTIDVAEEVRMSIREADAARRRKFTLQKKKSQLLTRFSDNHPRVLGVNRQVNEVQLEIHAAQRRIMSLPVLEQDAERLERTIKVNTDLYNALLNTAQQLRLVKVGRISNVRLIDAPMAPERPIKPNRPVIVLLAVIVGMFVGVVMAFLRRALSGAIDDPKAVERMLGARAVYAVIPHSKLEKRLNRTAKKRGGQRFLLAQAAAEDVAVESLRSFRTALLFSMGHFDNNIVMLAGASRELGKSFLTANLAAILAAGGKRVLLIDADLCHGCLQHYFTLPRGPGLTDIIAGTVSLDDAIQSNVLDNLDFIATGALPELRSELLLHQRFGAMLATVSAAYDLVLLDGPPILAGADALTIGTHAGAVFLVARGARTTGQEIEESIRRFDRVGVLVKGVLFNDLAPHLSDVERLGFDPAAHGAPQVSQ